MCLNKWISLFQWASARFATLAFSFPVYLEVYCAL